MCWDHEKIFEYLEDNLRNNFFLNQVIFWLLEHISSNIIKKYAHILKIDLCHISYANLKVMNKIVKMSLII
jgi:hypothetical protein